jgi:hypothetical protein
VVEDTAPAEVLDTGSVECGDFASVGQPFALTYCSACHSPYVSDRRGAPEEVDLMSLDDIRAHRERFAARVLDGTMPPGGGATTDEVDAVVAWLDCGAPGTDNALQPGTERKAGVATTALAEVSTTSSFPEGLTLRHQGEGAVLRERFLLHGGEAWLVQWRAGGRTVDYDPPLQIWSSEDSWTQQVEAFVTDSDGSTWTEDQTWSASLQYVVGDARDLTSEARSVILVSDDGDEHVWRTSWEYGLLARGLVDQSGVWWFQQKTGVFADNFGLGFPLREGAWTEKVLWVTP